MSDKLSQVNRILDRTCKRAGLDPIDVRLAMIQTLQAKLANGKGYGRLPPEDSTCSDGSSSQSSSAPVQPRE